MRKKWLPPLGRANVKEKKMAKRNLWMVMLVIALALGMVACDLEGDLDLDLEGDVTISGGNNAPATLTAEYDGEDVEVSYQWKKDGEAIGGATNKTYEATEAGSYTVTVSADGYVSKTSSAHTVSAPLPYADFLGTWKFVSSSGNTTETITLTGTKFRLDYKYMATPEEYFEFNITEWQAIDEIPAKMDISPIKGQEGIVCFKLVGTADNTGKYLPTGSVTPQTTNGLYLFMTSTKLVMYRGQPGMDDLAHGAESTTPPYAYNKVVDQE
jgi:hypothetical protein